MDTRRDPRQIPLPASRASRRDEPVRRRMVDGSQIAGPDPALTCAMALSQARLLCTLNRALDAHPSFMSRRTRPAPELTSENPFLLGVMAERSKAASLGTGLSTAFFGRGFESHSRH